MVKRGKAVALISAGMDSVTSAWIAKYGFRYEIAALHFSYGQRTEEKERACFKKIVERLGVVEKLVVDLKFMKQIGGSGLVDKVIDISQRFEDGIPMSYVPFRNGIFLSIAGAWAEVIGAEVIVIGATQVDFSGYPDCREEFLLAMERAINLGTRPSTRIQIVAPVLNLKKSEIIKKGIELGVPFELTWSCYEGKEKACGVCESCRLRLEAFREAGVEDPIPYMKR